MTDHDEQKESITAAVVPASAVRLPREPGVPLTSTVERRTAKRKEDAADLDAAHDGVRRSARSKLQHHTTLNESTISAAAP